MTSTLPKREKMVWLRFLVLVLVAVTPVILIAACMLICWIVRMISRLFNWFFTKPSLWLWTFIEWFAVVLGFAVKDPVLPPLEAVEPTLEEEQ